MKKSILFFVFLVLFVFVGCGLTDIPVMEEIPTNTAVSMTDMTFIDKVSPEDVRLFSYNVNWDSIFPDSDLQNFMWRIADRSEEFKRLIAATSPDIACLQEINPIRDSSQVSVIFDAVLPLEGKAKWQAVRVFDTVIVSRFDLHTKGYELYTPRFVEDIEQAAALVDLPDDTYGQDLYLICAHFASSGDQESINQRQTQADALVRQVGDLKTEGDYIGLALNTPFVFAGDFNVYNTDPAHHLVTLLTGDIVDEDQFGGDVQPDWDDTSLGDALPSINGAGEFYYTWREDGSNFDPGTLDRVIYSDSVMSVSHAYVLNTRTMSPRLLQEYGLQADDVLIDPSTGYYDHLPIIVDFSVAEH